MLQKLFARRVTPSAPTGCIPEGQRIYAVGDIHGRLDLLDELILRVREDDASRGEANTHFIFLGDLIDRGPESAQVVQRLLEFSRDNPSSRFLLGNHEEVFLTALSGDVKALKFFNRIGGRETIRSYGISETDYQELDYPDLLDRLIERVPVEHRTFIESFEDMIIAGDYAFVHAGVRPETPLAEQRIADLRWIRTEFLEHRGPHEKIIVHGHTIRERVETRSHRIGLDTGAYASGILTAMGFEGDRRWIVDTSN